MNGWLPNYLKFYPFIYQKKIRLTRVFQNGNSERNITKRVLQLPTVLKKGRKPKAAKELGRNLHRSIQKLPNKF